jgi:hypothetical protein
MVHKFVTAAVVAAGVLVGMASIASASSIDNGFGGNWGHGKAAPGPVAGAGLSFILIAGASYFIWRRRRKSSIDQTRA